MSAIVVPWLIIVVLLVLVGIVALLAAVRARLAKPWKITLFVFGLLMLGASIYGCLLLIGIAVP